MAPFGALAADLQFVNPTGGDLNVAANFAPALVPGPTDNVQLFTTATNVGPLTLYVASNQSIGSFTFGHYAQNIVDARLLNSTPYTLTLAQGQLNFTDAITESPGNALTSLFFRAPIAGSAGLTKTGQGFVNLSGANTYSGGTTIVGTGAGGALGGVSVSADSQLGAAGGAVTLSNNGTFRALASFTSSRAFTVTGQGRIESFGDLVLTGDFGPGAAPTVARFTSGSVQFGGTMNAGFNVANGNTVYLTGRSLGSINLGGTLTLGRGSVGPNADALGDTATLVSYGGTLNVLAAAATRSDSTGSLLLANGSTTLDFSTSVAAGVQLTFSQLVRQNRSTMFVRGRELGAGALAANRALINFTSTLGLPTVGGGGTTATNKSIVPFLLGNPNVTGGLSQVSAVDAGFVTLDAVNGLRPLVAADYATSLSSGATNNVRLSDNAFTQNTAVTINSLVIRDTSASFGNSGVGGTGTITVTSGAIAAVSDQSGEELFIDNPINFGAAEGVLHTAPTVGGHSLLILRGAVSGSNGLTKAGNGDLYLENANSNYGGTTTINAGVVAYSGNIGSGVNSALGNSTSAVVINAGVSGNQYVGLRASTPLSTFARPISVLQNADANSLALIGTVGDFGATFSGAVSVGGGFLNLQGGAEAEVLTLSGNITGAGGLQEPASAFPLAQYVRLTGTGNSYSGGTIIRAGRWEVGSNAALGTGTVWFEGNNTGGTPTGAIQAFGGTRTLANPLVFRAAPVFSGANLLIFTGNVDLGSVQRDVYVTNTADTSFTGTVGRGGLTKRGSGRLVLTGPNNHTGQTWVAEGALRAANNSALGTTSNDSGQATFITGTGTLELSGYIITGEHVYFGGDLNGTPQLINAASPTGNLRSVAGDNTISGNVHFDNVGTVGADVGSTLTLTGDTLDNTTTGSAVLRKVGLGTLATKNVRLSGLTIDGGTVRISPNGTDTGTSVVSSLTLGAATFLDLTNNAFIVDYSTTSPLATIQSLLLSGQIDTSVATAGAAVGFGEASVLFSGVTFPQTFAGQSVDATSVLLRQTLQGDANLNRTVDFNDLLTLARNYNGTGKTWATGDFDYNGSVDFNDLLALARNYNRTTLVDLASLDAGFAADWALAQSLVPEPALLSLLALAPLTRRRR